MDSNGNRITAGYTDGNLTSLTHSSGRQLLIDYNRQGRIWHVTDPLGPGTGDDRVTTFEYDASGEYLLRVIDPGDRTTPTRTRPAARPNNVTPCSASPMRTETRSITATTNRAGSPSLPNRAARIAAR